MVGRTVSLVLLGLLALPLLAAPSQELRGTDQQGHTHDLAAPAGTYTVVDFAASWCAPCYRALPQLVTLAEAHPQLRFLVVSVDDGVGGRDRLVADLDLRLPVIWDAEHAIVEHFRPRSLPATYILDGEGEVVYQHFGFDRKKWEALEARLRQLDPPPR